MQAIAQTETWTFNETTSGGDVTWTSSTAVSTQADQYQWDYDITYVGVDVIFLGVIIGPNDVTSDIDPKLLHGEDIVNGPPPIVFTNEPIEADGDADGTIDASAHLLMQINGKGQGQFLATKIYLGTTWVDTGFPFGWQEVDIDRIYIEGVMHVTEIENPCSEDTNGDDVVDVSDILTAIGNWGGSGDGDVDNNGVVDVSDILAIVSAWGPC
jgi:hypothetical protein